MTVSRRQFMMVTAATGAAVTLARPGRAQAR